MFHRDVSLHENVIIVQAHKKLFVPTKYFWNTISTNPAIRRFAEFLQYYQTFSTQITQSNGQRDLKLEAISYFAHSWFNQKHEQP